MIRTQHLKHLYERFVARYDTSARHRRTEDEIWRPVLMKLEERSLAGNLTEKVIAGSLDDVTFKHAWKNGQWNVYEPVSFDLADEDGIKRKAREWLGHLAAVVNDGDVEPFKPQFLVTHRRAAQCGLSNRQGDSTQGAEQSRDIRGKSDRRFGRADRR